MTKRVQLPDGTVMEFPDDATDEEIDAIVNEENPPAPQLRAGTGSFWGDIKQDAANIFLPEQFAQQIIQNQNPGSTIEPDGDGGYALVRKDGSRHDLNTSGFGYQDALKVTGAFGLGGGLGMVAKTIAPATSAAMRAWGITNPIKAGGVAGSTYSAGEQIVGDALTEDIPISGQEILNSGLFGMLPFIGMKAGGKVLDWTANRTGIDAFRAPLQYALAKVKQVLTPDGQLTSDAKKALEAAGIDPKAFTPEQIDIANSAAASNIAYNPAAQGRAASLATEGIEPTRGMQSQFPQDVYDEVHGLDRSGRETAINQLQQRGEELGPYNDLRSVGENLVELHNARLQQADDLFTEARRAGDVAPISGGRTASLRNSMRRDLEETFTGEQLDEVFDSFPAEISQSGNVTTATPTNIRKLYEWRRDHLSKLKGGQGREVFEAHMDDLIERSLLDDNAEEAIKAWRTANADFREYSKTWRAGDLVERIVQKDKQGSGLRYDPEQTANLLLNSSEAGFITKPGLPKAITKIKELVGEDSPAWRDLQNAMARRALKLKGGFKKDQRQGSIEVSGVNMMNHWDLAKTEAGDVLEATFPPEVIAKMDNFMQYARWMDTKLASEVPKTEGSAISQVTTRVLNRLADAHFRLTRSAFREAASVSKEVGVDKALREIYGDLYIPRGSNVPKAAASVATEQLLTEEYDDILRSLGWDIPDSVPGLTIPIINGVSDTP